MSLTISVNSEFVIDRLNQIAKKVGDMSPAFSAIGQELENRVRGRFETQSDPSGNAWAAWKPSTVERYPENGNHRVLDRYGDMLASLTHTSGETFATIGFGDPKAAYHEWGTKHMERRGLLFDDPATGTLGEDDELAVLDILSTFLQGAVQG